MAKTFNFKEAFCTVHKCSAEDYPRKMLFRSFSWHTRWIAHILFALETPSIHQAMETVLMLAFAEDARDVNTILSDYRYQLRNPAISSHVRRFKIRLSGSRVMNIFLDVKDRVESHSMMVEEAKNPPLNLHTQALSTH